MPFKFHESNHHNSERSDHQAAASDPLRPAALQNPEPAVGGPIVAQAYQEQEILKAIQWFASYLRSERDEYYPSGRPLQKEWRRLMDGYFAPAFLDQVRVVELTDRRVENPWFYPHAKQQGVRNLPDITHKAAVTFLDVVVFNERIGSRDLFHGLVHAAQAKMLGLPEFTELFVRGFLRTRSYFLVPLKAHAFALDARFASDPGIRFSVEREIRSWWLAGRY